MLMTHRLHLKSFPVTEGSNSRIVNREPVPLSGGRRVFLVFVYRRNVRKTGTLLYSVGVLINGIWSRILKCHVTIVYLPNNFVSDGPG